MATSSTHFFLLALLLSSAISIDARKLPSSGATLAERLQLDTSTYDCWGSLYELKSCTGEVILFFLNGETYLGPSCCRAIRVIEHKCWSTMLGTFGYTDEEGDVLREYCDSAESPPSPPEDDIKPDKTRN